ncbi:RNA demethylase ALKBH9B-like [Phoenix dactylifera]|uniref:RNA demethylase ALKBH9B-like n=2 Tax=Phoenix dactylifera TaxID=42345 RepID=A0A8B7BKE0_PHODC|nr:RNA demethylase ALKBH9B-like [Phoenix dactylifera]
MAEGASPPAVDNLDGKLDKVSIRRGGKGRSPASINGGYRSNSSSARSTGSSPASDWARTPGQHNRQFNNSSSRSLEEGDDGDDLAGAAEKARASGGTPLSRDQREAIRFSMVGRKKDFKHMERVDGRWINVLEGLELHTGVFSAAEQKRIVACVYDVQEKGRNRQLRRRTYSEPRKWMRGKGRVTIQFGCCYNYAVDNYGNPPGIIQDEEVDPMPPLLKTMIKRMVAWHVLPPTCVPDSCIVNIYDKDDCIPPHIDHHDFLRPFCTVSLLSKCNILFGRELKIMGPGEFSGSTAIPLPVGSVLVLNGNGADVAKHCVPAVPTERISITFRKMDDSKLPYKFSPDPALQNLHPLAYPPIKSPVQQVANTLSPNQQQITPEAQVLGKHMHCHWSHNSKAQEQVEIAGLASSSPFKLGSDDFPPLGSSSANGRSNKPSRPLRQELEQQKL